MRRVLAWFMILTWASVADTPQFSFLVLSPINWPAGHLPEGWQVKINTGSPEIATVQEGRDKYLDLKSHNSSYGVEREVDVDPKAAPYLTWKWKAKQLPAGGDFRRSRTDDQAAQVLVAFTDRHVLSYIWDTSAPQGDMESAGSLPLMHIYVVVCRSGSRDLNQWLRETHNVAEDYERAFGRPAPRVKGVRLQINTQHTGTFAESCFSEVAFRSAPQS